MKGRQLLNSSAAAGILMGKKLFCNAFLVNEVIDCMHVYYVYWD